MASAGFSNGLTVGQIAMGNFNPAVSTGATDVTGLGTAAQSATSGLQALAAAAAAGAAAGGKVGGGGGFAGGGSTQAALNFLPGEPGSPTFTGGQTSQGGTFDVGGTITEPIYGVGMQSGAPYQFAWNGAPETITPVGQGPANGGQQVSIVNNFANNPGDPYDVTLRQQQALWAAGIDFKTQGGL